MIKQTVESSFTGNADGESGEAEFRFCDRVVSFQVPNFVVFLKLDTLITEALEHERREGECRLAAKIKLLLSAYQ
jgi:hypothetical protein